METERIKTPKEKYDEEMKVYNKAIADNKKLKSGELPEDEGDLPTEEELQMAENAYNEVIENEEVEDDPLGEKVELDKNLGEKGFSTTVTLKEHSRNKLEETRKKILEGQIQSKSRAERISPEQKALLNGILSSYEKGELKDEVLIHLIKKKIDQAGKHAALAVKIKEVQMRIVKEMTDLTNEVGQSQAKNEVYTEEILDRYMSLTKE